MNPTDTLVVVLAHVRRLREAIRAGAWASHGVKTAHVLEAGLAALYS